MKGMAGLVFLIGTMTLQAQNMELPPDEADRLIALREEAVLAPEKEKHTRALASLDLVLRSPWIKVLPGTFQPQDRSWIFTVVSTSPQLPWTTVRLWDGNSYTDPERIMASLKDAVDAQALEGVLTYRITPRDEEWYACTVKTVDLVDTRTSQILATTSPGETVAIFTRTTRNSPVTTASLEVRSRPSGAQVTLDGVPQGTTPLKVPQLPPYRTEVVLTWEGQSLTPWKTFLDMEVGKSYLVDYKATVLDMADIPGGTYLQGSLEGFEDERPPVSRTVKPFQLGRREVSQALWKDVMGSNPSFRQDDSLPVENITWFQAVDFCNRLSLREGLEPVYAYLEEGVVMRPGADGYRLPSETEWEYAARAGRPAETSSDEGWHRENSGGSVHGSGELPANPWGLQDMAGNLWEWVWDVYGPYRADSEAPGTGKERVIRGGSWLSESHTLKAAHRDRYSAEGRRIVLGFRVARNAGEASEVKN